LGFDLFQEATAVLVKHYNKKTTPQVVDKKVVMTDSNIEQDFVAVYSARGDSGDFAFKLVGDKQVKVHKALLSNVSNELDTLIRSHPTAVVPTRPQFPEYQITYNRLTADAFESMLKFVYYSHKNITLFHATQLYQFAKDYKLGSLVTTLDTVMGAAEVDIPSVLFMLQIAFTEMTDKKDLQASLKTKGLQFVVANLDKIDFKPLDNMSPIIGTSIVEAVQAAVKKNNSNWESMKANFNKDPKPIPTSATSNYTTPPPMPSSPSPSIATASTRATPASPTSPAGAKVARDDEDASATEGDGKGEKKSGNSRTKKESKKPLQEEDEGKKGNEKDDGKKGKDSKGGKEKVDDKKGKKKE